MKSESHNNSAVFVKNKSKELDVDFIGGQVPMTKSEELAISQFLKAQKILKAKIQTRRTRNKVWTK